MRLPKHLSFLSRIVWGETAETVAWSLGLASVAGLILGFGVLMGEQSGRLEFKREWACVSGQTDTASETFTCNEYRRRPVGADGTVLGLGTKQTQ